MSRFGSTAVGFLNHQLPDPVLTQLLFLPLSKLTEVFFRSDLLEAEFRSFANKFLRHVLGHGVNAGALTGGNRPWSLRGRDSVEEETQSRYHVWFWWTNTFLKDFTFYNHFSDFQTNYSSFHHNINFALRHSWAIHHAISLDMEAIRTLLIEWVTYTAGCTIYLLFPRYWNEGLNDFDTV